MPPLTHLLSRLAFAVLAFGLCPLLLFFVLYRMPWAATWTALGLATCVAWARLHRPGVPRVRSGVLIGLLIVVLLGGIVSVPASLSHMEVRTRTLMGIVRSHGPRALSGPDRLSIALLAGSMAALGAPIFPETALEQALMFVSGPKRRVWRSDFAMESKKVRAVLQKLERRLTTARDDSVSLKPTRVAWPGYDGGMRENRVALALNPCVISADATRDGESWIVDVVARVSVRYPPSGEVWFFRLGRSGLMVDEGLFWALQEVRWLHPYEAEWHWSFRTPPSG